MPDPQHSTARRQQRTKTFASHLASASLEWQLITTQTARAELETKLCEKEVLVELEGDDGSQNASFSQRAADEKTWAIIRALPASKPRIDAVE